ncbi:serine/threonine protein kinase [Fusarium austroafricanum]|uniref:Serine/threonine protein kinase n=1 Tax=Fusarium austroafricanum TaxID=2364996 RepID=A0A8H4NW97_9HYPO|nr:serine/threonine protein kinase [Fusarium austroafricanum]
MAAHPGGSLKALLKAKRIRNDGKTFIPVGAIRSLCKRAAVLNELHDEGCADYVCDPEKPALKIFATLILHDRLDCISKFRDAGINDGDLPLGSTEQRTELWSCRSPDKQPIASFRYPEDDDLIKWFYNTQWSVHVPFLDLNGTHHRFERGTLMPWKFLDKYIDPGGFADVQKLEIHPDHYSGTQHSTFALKTIRNTTDRIAFIQEIDALRKIRRGPHLVELLATIEIDVENRFMLIFPWAEGRSLKNMMGQDKRQICDPFNLTSQDLLQWVVTQCRGLIAALETIHYAHLGSRDPGEKDYGVHFDIKPDNILYFSQETDKSPFGTLKIADCGLTTFYSRNSRSKKRNWASFPGSLTYRSPEHDIRHVMSKKVDVWAMGCVFTELLTWAILPHGSLHRYSRSSSRSSSRGPSRRPVKEFKLARFREPTDTSSSSADDSPEDNFFSKNFGTPKLKNSVSQSG